MFCSDRMSGAHFIVQKRIFVLISATTVTLGQGQGKSSNTFPQNYLFFVPNI